MCYSEQFPLGSSLARESVAFSGTETRHCTARKRGRRIRESPRQLAANYSGYIALKQDDLTWDTRFARSIDVRRAAELPTKEARFAHIL